MTGVAAPARADEGEDKRWLNALHKQRKTILAAAAKRRPGVAIDATQLPDDLITTLLADPRATLRAADAALERFDVPIDPRPRLRARPVNLPDDARRIVREILRDDQVGRLVAVRGIVKRVGLQTRRTLVAVFKCPRCGAIIQQPQRDIAERVPPLECYDDQGGCGRGVKNSKAWELIDTPPPEKPGETVDYQEAILQDLPEGSIDDQPRRVDVVLHEDLVGTLHDAHHVVVNAIVRSRYVNKGTISHFYLEAISMEDPKDDFITRLPTEEQVSAIKAAAAQPTALADLRACLAPHIEGLVDEKTSVVLSLFGGTSVALPSGELLRGELHTLLAGDPSVAKTQLLRSAASLAPRAIFANGTSSSGPGLTATCKQEKGPGGDQVWVIEPGAVVLAHLGILCLDELDKLKDDDANHMLQVTESGKFEVHKAASATFVARITLIAGMNPKGSRRFDNHTPKLEQLGMNEAFRTRFDIIWIMQDEPNHERDARIGRAVLRARRGASDPIVTPYDRDFVRMWIQYARANVHPTLSGEAEDFLLAWWRDIRKTRTNEDIPVAITTRQLEGAARIAQAHARVSLRDLATLDDARFAVRHLRESLSRYAIDKNGRLDIDALEARALGQDEKARVLIDIVRREHAQMGPVPEDHAANEAEKRGLDRAEALRILKFISERNGAPIERDGTFYRPVR